MKQKYFAVKHNDPVVCRKSSSGGAFSAITDSWFQAFGEYAVVYGCVMDEQLQARHVRAVDSLQAAAMRGSKYVGSNTAGVFRQVETDLQNGQYVCFSGTPCQVAALNAYLRDKCVEIEQRLLTLEVICHGVGSTRFFKDYIDVYESKYQSKVTSCSFRGKMRPGKRQQMVLCFENGKIYESPSSRTDEFLSAYGRNYILRPSCYCCPYAKQERQGDITLGDAWCDVNGNGLVRTLLIVNSQLGKDWMRRTMDRISCQILSEVEAYQPQLSMPAEKPADYEDFWKIYRISGYEEVQRYLGNRKIRGILRKYLDSLAYSLYVAEILRGFKIKAKRMTTVWGRNDRT